jgi:hypothetical protein
VTVAAHEAQALVLQVLVDESPDAGAGAPIAVAAEEGGRYEAPVEEVVAEDVAAAEKVQYGQLAVLAVAPEEDS